MQVSRRRLLGTLALGAGAAVLAACGQSGSTPAATSAPAKPAPAKPAESKPAEAAKPAAPAAQPAATTAPAPAAAAKPTEAAAAKPVAVSNPPTTPEMVDSIDLTGKNIEVVYWHNRPQKDQELLQ